MDEVRGTHQTYKRIAIEYARKWSGGGPVTRDVSRFVALVRPGGLVLDVGCGPGFDTAVLQSHNLHTIGLDYSMEMMQTGRQQYQITTPLVRADMRCLPLAAAAADGLWVSASLLHLPRTDVPHTMAGFYRLLKPGGILYLSLKMGDGAAWVEQAYGHNATRFFTFWQPDELDSVLTAAQFTIVDGWVDQTTNPPWVVRFAQK